MDLAFRWVGRELLLPMTAPVFPYFFSNDQFVHLAVFLGIELALAACTPV